MTDPILSESSSCSQGSPSTLRSECFNTERSGSALTDDNLNSYLQTILWIETDEDSDPLDDSYDVDDFDNEGAQQQRKECESFIAENREAVDFLLENGVVMSTILHYFWLTRCGYGAGFWDIWDRPEKFDLYAQNLSASANRYGQKWVYVSDDGVIYFS